MDSTIDVWFRGLFIVADSWSLLKPMYIESPRTLFQSYEEYPVTSATNVVVFKPPAWQVQRHVACSTCVYWVSKRVLYWLAVTR